MSKAPACAPTSPPKDGRAAAPATAHSPHVRAMSPLAEMDLSSGVHVAHVAEDVVVLDVQADAYILIPGGSSQMELTRGGGGIRAEVAVLKDLADAGLTVPSTGNRRRPLIPAIRQASLPLFASSAARIPALLHAVATTVAFQNRGLAGLVDAAARRKVPARRRDLEAVVRETDAFEAIRPWVPFEGDCLQRSWMLHDRLCRRGFEADWVFGVRTWPFFAHCWVQVDDVVVGDTLNRVGGFTPIMAV